MLRMWDRASRLTLAAVTAVGGVAFVTPPAIAAPYISAATAFAGMSPDELAYAGPASYYTYVANTGDQDAVNECAGGLTYFPTVSNFIGKPYYPIHNECGGRPILFLEQGDLAVIRGIEVFRVVSMRDVSRGDTANELVGLDGDIFLQTCHDTGELMRVVGLVKAA